MNKARDKGKRQGNTSASDCMVNHLMALQRERQDRIDRALRNGLRPGLSPDGRPCLVGREEGKVATRPGKAEGEPKDGLYIARWASGWWVLCRGRHHVIRVGGPEATREGAEARLQGIRGEDHQA